MGKTICKLLCVKWYIVLRSTLSQNSPSSSSIALVPHCNETWHTPPLLASPEVSKAFSSQSALHSGKWTTYRKVVQVRVWHHISYTWAVILALDFLEFWILKVFLHFYSSSTAASKGRSYVVLCMLPWNLLLIQHWHVFGWDRVFFAFFFLSCFVS